MKTLSRRSLLGSVSAIALLWPAEAFTIEGGAKEGGVGTTQLTIMTLVNTSRSTQASGFVTPIFGLTFKKGDIPSGTAPIFTIGGTAQPYSWGLQSYWSDGSLRHASFMFRCSSSIAGNETLTVNINSGGTAPSASSRTLTEAYAQTVQVGGPGIGAFGGLVGTWNGYLRNDANNVEQYVYMEGQAGKSWRVKTHMATSAGGSAHGQLEVYHYITALQDNGGNLGGFRHIARISQPYYNRDAPTKALRAFSSITTQYGAGPTTINLTWPFNNINFTGTNGSSTFTVASEGTHNLYNGAQPGEGSDYVNCVPGYLSSTTDAALSTSQIYFAYTYGAATNNAVFRLAKNNTGINGAIASSGGTSTFVPIAVCLHAGSIYTADSQGRSNFFQGTGSMSADCTVRTQFDRVYLHSTGAIPPWNLSLSGTAFGGTIKDIPAIVGASSSAYWRGTPTWNPVTAGPLANAWRGGPGSIPDIGPLSTWHCAHFYNQSAVGDMAIRAIAFSSDFDGTGSIRDVSTSNYANFSNSPYAGLASPSRNQQSVLWVQSNSCFGFTPPSTPPANNTGFLWGGEQAPSHRPSCAFYAFLVFGEAYFHDLMIEAGLGGVLEWSSGGRVPTSPSGQYGIVMTYSTQGLRGSAWALRDLMLAASFGASSSPDGSQLPTYLNDLVAANMTYINSLFSATHLGSTLSSENSWRKIPFDNATPGTPDPASGGFMNSYFECVMAWMAALENSAALTWANKYATWLNYVISTWGAYHLYSEFDGVVIPSDQAINSWKPIMSFDQWGITAGVYGTLTWQNGSSPYFKATAPILGYVATAGDKYVFMADAGAPGGFSTATAYYARDLSGNSFNLSASPGGPAITPTNSGTIIPQNTSLQGCASPYCTLAAPPSAASGLCPNTATGTNDSYLLYRFMAWCWSVAVGASGYSSALSDATTRLKANLPDITSNANWYGQNKL